MDNIKNMQIKSEEMKDEDILLFSQLEQFKNGHSLVNGFQLLNEISDDEALSFSSSLINKTPQQFDISSEKFDEIENKTEDDKDGCKKHFVRYKMQDGKHIKIWSCGICSKDFGHQYTLMRHLPTHTDERKFQCNACGKAFRQMSTLSQHRAIHSSIRPYICEICHKTFNRVSTLISHRKTHTGLKPHRCHLCNKAFHQKGNLRNHIFTHTNERPYKCEDCDKGFNQMSNLMCHKIKAHQRSETPKYVCQICGHDFAKRVSLRNHEQFQHGLNLPVEASLIPEKMKYSNAIIVNPIQTEAMRLALESNQTPFALLRPLTGIPVLVRVLPAGDKQMLIPATAEDLKKHGHISITPKIAKKADTSDDLTCESPDPQGSTVQIKIPVVATVIQQSGRNGLSMSVVSPGPNEEVINNIGKSCSTDTTSVHIYTSAPATCQSDQNDIHNAAAKQKVGENSLITSEISENTEIEFLDNEGNVISEQDFRQHLPENSAIYKNNDIILVESPEVIKTDDKLFDTLEEHTMDVSSLEHLPLQHVDEHLFDSAPAEFLSM